MASIRKEFLVQAPVAFVWDAIKDVGAVHTRLAKGFVLDTKLADGARTVTFANGTAVRELIVDINDEERRLAYSVVGGRATHHNAYIQASADVPGQTKVLWVTDLLPNEMRVPIAQMVEIGAAAIKQTLEDAYRSKV
jgi:carbon monoxide dehydrogenase subunit G